MPNNVDPPTFPHPAYDHSTSGVLSDTQRESENDESDIEAGLFYGPIDSPFNANYLGPDPHSPNTLAGLIDWETIAPRTPGMVSPSSQEVHGGTGVFDAVPTTYPTYSDAYFDQDPLPTADELVPQTMVPSPYPIGQMANLDADDSRFRAPWGMECQSVSNTIYMNRSPSRPLSAPSDRDGLTAWPGPDYTPLTPDRSDRSSLGLPFNPLDCASSCGSVEDSLEDGEATLGSRHADDTMATIPNFGAPAVTSLPLPVLPVNLFKIPQERYTQRKGARTSPRLEEINFSVNGVPGFKVQCALRQLFTGLDGRDDPVLEDANGPVSCRILFPGYPADFRFSQIAVQNWKKKRAPITRSKLAYEIAKRVKQYLDAFAAHPIDSSVDARWTIGKGCMKLEKMHLVSVAWVSRGSIQPEIWVDDS